MLRYGCSLILMLVLLSACSSHMAKGPLPIESFKTKQVRQFTSFNQLDIQGQINVSLHTSYKQPQVVLSGDARDLAQIKALVSKNRLYLILEKGYPRHSPVYIDITTQPLNYLAYQGTGLFTGSQLHTGLLDLHLANRGTTRLSGSINLRLLEVTGEGSTEISGLASQNLQIHLKGSPRVQLAGVADLTHLFLEGSPWLSLYWVKADSLKVRMRQSATLQLAGTVNRLDLVLCDRAHFKGRYLRAQRSFVRAHNHAIAEISTLNHQTSLATDTSSIYYYNLPNTCTDFMAFDGSVLDMREWNQSYLRDFDAYNKHVP